MVGQFQGHGLAEIALSLEHAANRRQQFLRGAILGQVGRDADNVNRIAGNVARQIRNSNRPRSEKSDASTRFRRLMPTPMRSPNRDWTTAYIIAGASCDLPRRRHTETHPP